MYQQLIDYKEKYKTTNVSQKFKEDPQLGIWVTKQRQNYRNKMMSKYRVDLLNSIQFVWDQKG
eukprot:CAMPEP_0170983570 /NCGR_PEP_ID=MMETSP0736-20130129/4327_1 /TAXON_ID=186038 /ORGANISM="Fragilariopsis kerguelensis, Strain L26-C5" /LENGTH=62 /DNA_ID=CAMNT_0011407063 /DNA_START=27 /DNA_END=212 /DNA_ORIENTATION=-